MKTKESYTGFEQGPIRPPSEAGSLLIRITRNCPWNRCTFCPVYKGTKFSLRPVDHVLMDIDTIQKRPGYFRPVAMNLVSRTKARMLRIGQVSAGTGVHGGDQHEIGWIGQCGRRPRDGYPKVFKRLTQDLENMFFIFRQFVQK